MNQTKNRILIPLDGSPAAEAVLATIMPLVRARPSEVLLLRVAEATEVSPAISAYLERAATALSVHGVQVSHDLALGRPAPAILSFARENQCTLIAMSTHGRTGLSRALVGSVTEEVLRHADVPLLACRPTARPIEVKRILVALDGSPVAETILPDVTRMALTLSAEIHVVRVAVPIVMVGGLTDYPMSFPPDDPMPYLNEVCTRLRTSGVRAEPIALVGGPAVELTRHAEACGAGMICLASHGRTGVARLVLGSIAEAVLRSAPCPVLVRRFAPQTQSATVADPARQAT